MALQKTCPDREGVGGLSDRGSRPSPPVKNNFKFLALWPKWGGGGEGLNDSPLMHVGLF